MGTKRNKHPGVTPLGRGWYRIRTEVIDPKTGRVREIDRRVRAKSGADAATILANVRAEWLRKRVRSVAAGPRRLGDALEAWIDRKRKEVRPSTASTYGSAVAWWRELLGDYLVERVDPADIRDAMLGARDGGESTDTINGRLRVLRTFAREEKCAGIVEGVRALERDVREDEADEDEGRGLSLEELRAFLAAGPEACLWRKVARKGRAGPAQLERVDPARWVRVGRAWARAWALVATMAWSGLRFGEASALEWRDVDLDAGTIRVRRAQWRGHLGHTKAKASKRLVVIPDELVELLREHRRAMVSEQQRGVDSPLVFPSPRGARYVSNTYARKAILKVCAVAKIDRDERPAVHMLRHTWNNLIRQNATELVRQALIGHADEEVGKLYSAVTIEERRAAVGSVVRMVRGEGE